MQFDKEFVIDELKMQGQSQHLQAALDELPHTVDHEQHAALLTSSRSTPDSSPSEQSKPASQKL